MDIPGSFQGKVITVNGPVEPSTLGVTLTHEHLYHEANARYFTPRAPDPRYMSIGDKPFDPRDLWWINYHPYSHRDNLLFNDDGTMKLIKEEMDFFKSNGGNCIVECTTFGTSIPFLKQVSSMTGVDIVSGTGYYVYSSVDESIRMNHKVEDVVTSFERSFQTGHHGILGEIGSVYPIHPFEQIVLEAVGILSASWPELPISLHPGRSDEAPDEIMRKVTESGGKQHRMVMCHLDRTLNSYDQLDDFADNWKGVFLEFDLFGVETSFYELSDTLFMCSDSDRIDRIHHLTDGGHGDRILLSQDIHTKQRLMHHGGHGFSHMLINVVPAMKRKGLNEETIQGFLQQNPQRWLTWTK